jgi:hypothetical protein
MEQLTAIVHVADVVKAATLIFKAVKAIKPVVVQLG